MLSILNDKFCAVTFKQQEIKIINESFLIMLLCLSMLYNVFQISKGAFSNIALLALLPIWCYQLFIVFDLKSSRVKYPFSKLFPNNSSRSSVKTIPSQFVPSHVKIEFA